MRTLTCDRCGSSFTGETKDIHLAFMLHECDLGEDQDEDE
jgi:hypothetical protein